MLRFLFYGTLVAFIACLGAAFGVLWWASPQLPTNDELRDVHFQTPLKVYSSDGELIAEFGEKRRIPVTFADTPDLMLKAFLAAEDDRFYQHPGVDWMAILRAAWELAQTGEKTQGGSTITMQVARNFFLSNEKTYTRKLKEIVLALKIEREFSKAEILELYLNKIFLGHRAYGVGAAAQVYYGKAVSELTLPEIAMIAGLPKAPSTTNPISNPARALDRRAYVLGRMLELDFIDHAAFEAALQSTDVARLHGQRNDLDAPYVAEMVRAFMQEKYGDESQTEGFSVFTTVTGPLQRAANEAARRAMLAYDLRHGYRGPEQRLELAPDAGEPQWSQLLDDFFVLGGLQPALVIGVQDNALEVYLREAGRQRIEWDGLKWARSYIDEDRRGGTPANAGALAKAGDIVRVELVTPAVDPAGVQAAPYWRLAQLPAVEGALISLDPDDGAIKSLVGGFDFNKSKFNRVMQAQRQPGSNFKPFIYSAALEQGYTAASFINDAPIVFDAPGLDGTWRPENYSGRYYGPTRLRDALAQSRNLVSIRLLNALGVEPTVDYITRFGFDPQRMPHNLSLSLGSGELTPLELVSGYAVFANGGHRVEPYFVTRIDGGDGQTIYQAEPPTVCELCTRRPDLFTADGEPVDLAALIEAGGAGRQMAPRVIDPVNAWIMTSMMQDVIRKGTGRRALELKRGDLAGKTGTTNDQKDAWFSGFNRGVVTTVWIGFDQSTPLGRNETGGVAALPMWIDYMRVALEGVPETTYEQPPGLVTVRIDPNTGMVADADNPDAIFESFRAADVPKIDPGNRDSGLTSTSSARSANSEQIF